MTISVTEIHRMRTGDRIIDARGRIWPVVKNEKRGGGWRHIVLDHPDGRQKDVWFWFHPDQQCIVDVELHEVEGFSDPDARLESAA